MANGGTIIGSTGTVNNLTVTNNNFTLTNSAVGINPTNVGGAINISGNTFNKDGSSGNIISLTPNGTTTAINISNNTILGNGTSGNGILFRGQNNSVNSLAILNNTISNVSTGIELLNQTGAATTATIQNNTVNAQSNGMFISNDGGTQSVVIASNEIVSGLDGMQLLGTATSLYNVQGNSFGGAGKAIFLSISAATTASFTNNSATISASPLVSLNVNSGGSLTVALYENNIFPNTATVQFNNTSGGTGIIQNSSALQNNTPTPQLNGSWTQQ